MNWKKRYSNNKRIVVISNQDGDWETVPWEEGEELTITRIKKHWYPDKYPDEEIYEDEWAEI